MAAVGIRKMEQRIQDVARDIDVKIDPALTTVRHDPGSGIYVIVVSCTTHPEDEKTRSLLESGMQAALLDEFSDVSRDRLDIRVIVPYVMASDPPPRARDASGCVHLPAHEWIQGARGEWRKFMKVYATQLFHAALRRALDSYPWRDRASMEGRVPWLVSTYLEVADPVMACNVVHNAVDALLPPVQAILHTLDAEHVMREASAWLGRPPATALELYEAVHRRIVGRGRAGQPTAVLALYDQLFLY